MYKKLRSQRHLHAWINKLLHTYFSATHLRECRMTRRSCGALRDTPSSTTTTGEFLLLLTYHFFPIASYVVQLEKIAVYNNVKVRFRDISVHVYISMIIIVP